MRDTDIARAQDEMGGDVAYQVVGSAPAEENLRTARERAQLHGAVDVHTVPVQSEPVAALVGLAAEESADLVVVGNRGLRSLAGRLLGSVPANVARRSGADVLIVHTT